MDFGLKPWLSHNLAKVCINSTLSSSSQHGLSDALSNKHCETCKHNVLLLNPNKSTAGSDFKWAILASQAIELFCTDMKC